MSENSWISEIELVQLQEELYAEGKQKLLIVIQAMDAEERMARFALSLKVLILRVSL